MLLVPACNCGKPIIDRPDSGRDGGALVLADGGRCGGDCLSRYVTWGQVGGIGAPVTYSMFPCHAFSIDGNGYCTGVVTCFDPRINTLLADPVITAAIDSGTICGHDGRPGDAPVLQVGTNTGSFYIGDCDATKPCPSQATELVALLTGISDQRPCSISADRGVCSNECTKNPVTWQWMGGLTAFELRSSLATCQSYTLEKLENGVVTATCTAEARCHASELNYAIEDVVITTALAQHTLFGRDTRPFDGQVLHVTAKGGSSTSASAISRRAARRR